MPGEGSAEVVIRFGEVDALSQEDVAKGACHRYEEKEAFLYRRGLGSILVRDGREILVDPSCGEEAARPLVLNAGMAILLHQRGTLALHASSVTVGGRAAVFLGVPGAGKSTTAAALYHRGHGLLSDEVVAVQMREEGAFTFAGAPVMRLMPESLQSLGCDFRSLPRVHPQEEKRIQMAERNFSPGPFPVRRIYIVEPGLENKIEPLGPQQAFVELLRNSYAAGLLKSSGASSHLSQCARLINEVPIRRLTRCQDLSQLAGVAQMIEADLGKTSIHA